jgi:hypothetical protein
VFWYFTRVLDYLQHLQKYHHSKKNKVNMLKSGQNDEDSDEDRASSKNSTRKRKRNNKKNKRSHLDSDDVDHDGGNSDSLYFFNTLVYNVIVTADDKTKKYGETLPSFTYHVTINGVPLENTNITIDSLGLDDITFITSGSDLSDVGNYYIQAQSDITDLSIPRSLTFF